MSVNDTLAQDKNTYPATDTVRAELHKAIRDFAYWSLNGIASGTVAATPLVARATTATKVKTTNATVALNAGQMNAVSATDNAWTLTGGDLAAGQVRRYMLLVDASDAFTVLASDDQATAGACRWSTRPADGQACLGVLTVAATATFTPGTTNLGTGNTDTYIDGHDNNCYLATPPNP